MALGSWMNLLDKRIENDALEKYFIEYNFPEWEKHREEAYTLPAAFPGEMSPKILFDTPPLARCSDKTKMWLGQYIHERWLDKYKILAITENALSCIKNVDKSYDVLQEKIGTMKNKPSLGDLRVYKDMFNEYRNHCVALAKAIETFPSEVLIF